MAATTQARTHSTTRPLLTAALVIGALLVAALLVWQGVAVQGTPDPTSPHLSPQAAVLNVAVLVFREGLECILVLTAITAGLMGSNGRYREPIAAGVGVGMVATVITWFVAVAIIDDLASNLSALSVQAGTGILAIVVLLVVMNWFFHKVYWTGWISMHNRKKRSLLQSAGDPEASTRRILLGLGLLGLTSFYREGFEVVLFLQSYRMRLGMEIVLYGALLGIIFTGIVAVLNFVGHHRLPYKKMLTVTGVMLAVVLFVMVGEEINEMQLAHWIGVTPIPWLDWIPSWAGLWLSIFPNWETVIAQVVSMVLVLGSYFVAQYGATILPKKQGLPAAERASAPPTEELRPARPVHAKH